MEIKPETYSVRLVGAPLRRNVTDKQSRKSLEAVVVVIFEVRSEEGRRPPWRIQREYMEVARLHAQLSSELPWAALPRLPETRPVGAMTRLFRSAEAEEQRLRELAEQLQEYLNTLLAIPSVNTCTVLQLFLNIPQQTSSAAASASAAEYGEAAAETVADTAGALCSACRAFCATLARRHREDSDSLSLQAMPSEPLREGGTSSWLPGSFSIRSLTSASSEPGASSRGEQLASRQPNAAREVVLPLDGKLEEWK